MPVWIQIIIIASTIGGLGFAAFGLWLGAKQKQFEASTSMNELKETVAAQQKQLEAAERRFQNLETIVTSQVWDAVHQDGLKEGDRERVLSNARFEFDALADEPSDTDQVAKIAKRLRS